MPKIKMQPLLMQHKLGQQLKLPRASALFLMRFVRDARAHVS